MLEWVKAFHALDLLATVAGQIYHYGDIQFT
jgi:hypothetical protein